MDLLKSSILSIVVFLPLIGALLIFLHEQFFGKNDESLRRLALGVSLATLVFSLPLIEWYQDPDIIANFVWVENLGIRYHLQIDGLSLWLVLLTTVLTPIAI